MDEQHRVTAFHGNACRKFALYVSRCTSATGRDGLGEGYKVVLNKRLSANSLVSRRRRAAEAAERTC